MSYLERLDARMRRVGSCLCLGVDPEAAALPAGFTPDVTGVERFARLVVEAAGPHAAAVKVNLAFFEAFGSAGLAALERLRASVPPELPFIADAKRADIGSTALRQAAALFDTLAADAVTANPYLGADAVEPFLERLDRFTYVLCRTSNPGAAEVQNLIVEGTPLYVHVARRVADWAKGRPTAGLVVGATAMAEMAQIRAAVPQLPFLVPGVGAQGGDIGAALEHGPATDGAAGARVFGGLLVNVSRGISGAALERPAGTDLEQAIAGAAAEWSARLAGREARP